MRATTFVAASAVLLSCSSNVAQSVQESALVVDLYVDVLSTQGGDEPVARIKVSNQSSQRVAFTETFGFADLFLNIEIKREDGSLVAYPAASQYELFSDPPFRCLQPGQVVRLSIQLNSWYHIFGGRLDVGQEVPEKGPYSFDLPPGGIYHARVLYEYYGPRSRFGCRTFVGEVESSWVEFQLDR